MPAAAVDAAFKSRLASQWTATPVIGVNGVTVPPNNQSFLVVQFPVSNGEKPVLSGKYFEEGAARLVLNVRAGMSSATALGWADTLAALFREHEFGSGLETFVPSGPLIDDQIDDGNFVEYAVIVPYRYQFS